MKNTSLYVHIPFCKRKCRYCDFYSVVYDKGLANDYIDVLTEQVNLLHDKQYSFDTVYVGGGTPSVLDNEQIQNLLSAVHVNEGGEYTVEINPESVDFEKLCLIKNCGVNRLSVGVQSFNDDVLKFLGRPHDSNKALDAVNLAQECGFENVSIDLIYAVPGKTMEMWEDELKIAVKLPIKHISLYSLTYEEGTPLYRALMQKEFLAVHEEDDDQMYRFAQKFLKKHGFNQYEISNFAKKGYESKHNSMYWRNEEYVGLGAGAVEYFNGQRRRHVSSVKEYIQNHTKNKEIFEDVEELPKDRFVLETAILNLRSINGIDFDLFLKKTGYDIRTLKGKEIQQLLAEDLLEYFENKKGLRLTEKGLGFYDHVARELL